ncbi:MAG TPA: MFS transporter, partial [Candidatus Caenarcaniphilales bacterium]
MSNSTDESQKSNVSTLEIAGAALGNIMEWYDFGAYGYIAPIIGSQFFPKEDGLAQLIGSYAIFATGFFFRPLGGAFFGQLGDYYGRSFSLRLSIVLMVGSTVALGCLPAYQQLGIVAPLLLVLLRIVQGFSVGGELTTSMTYLSESTGAKHKAFFSSLPIATAALGIMISSLVILIVQGNVSPDALQTWGWRLPFLFAILPGAVVLWLRRNLRESPEFQALKTQPETLSQFPVLDAV